MGNHSMGNKIIEYGIILLHICKVGQTEVISRLLFTFLLTNYKSVWDQVYSNTQIPTQVNTSQYESTRV